MSQEASPHSPAEADPRPATPRLIRLNSHHWSVLALVIGILYTSLAHRGSIDCRAWSDALLRESLSLQWSDALGNFVAYGLLGAAIVSAWLRGRPAPRGALVRAGLGTLLACSALSFGVEASQACFTERFSSAYDWLLNTLGGGAGAGVMMALHHLWLHPLHQRAPRDTMVLRRRALIGLAVAAWAISDTAPWRLVPALDLAAANLAGLWQALIQAQLDPWRLTGHGAEWLALGLGVASVLPRARSAGLRLLSLALAVITLRLFMPEVLSTPPEQVITLLIALPLVLMLPRRHIRPFAQGALAAALLAALAWQLEPGYGAPQPMRWRVLLLHGDAIVGMQEAAWWGWWTLTLVVCGSLHTHQPYRWALVPPSCVALLTALQTLIPGRTPDLSGLLLTGVCAAVTARILAGARHRPALHTAPS